MTSKYYKNPEKELKQKMRNDFFNELKDHLAKVGYRADLHIVGSKKTGENKYTVKVKFDNKLGYPQDKDLMSLVAQSYDDYEIEWQSVEVDNEGEIYFDVVPEVEVIPLSDISKIPPEFVNVGTGIYKRASDEEKTVFEIWELRKGQDAQLALYKKNDDLEVTSEKEQFRTGDFVKTPYGVGKIDQFDEVGNALVQIGDLKKMVAASDLFNYKIENEKKKLYEYYKEIYGEEYAKDLVSGL